MSRAPQISDTLKEYYPRSMEVLAKLIGEKELEELSRYLHAYEGNATSVKPRAKNITIYWVGRLGAEAVIRTEGEDDIILTVIRGEALPTLIFRKFKAVALRAYMELMRNLWDLYKSDVMGMLQKDHSDIYGESYDFLQCGISPGIEGGRAQKKEGVMQQRCMRCPVDVLMGAVSGGDVEYNLASRFMGDPAFATTPSYKRRTGNAVDEVAYITGMGAKKGGTGALYTDTPVEPGTIFVGKLVLFMPSPVELVYSLYLLSVVNRYGARKSIMGSMEIYPVAIIGDEFEVGTAYAATEKVVGERELDEVIKKVYEYAEGEASSRSVVIDARGLREKVRRELDVSDKQLYLEAWGNAARYVKGVLEYIRS